ncbi:MAG: hypothetical protein WC004_03190 [Candidatus Absconditabacterales bacterium]
MNKESMYFDFLSKKGGNKTTNLTGLQSILKQIIEAIQHDMGGEHSDDPVGTYNAQECNSPIDSAARQVTICNYPDPNNPQCPPEHCAVAQEEYTSVNPTGTLIQLFADKSDLSMRSRDLVNGLYTEIRLLKNGKIELEGYIDHADTKQTKFNLIFALEGGSVE